MRQFIADLPVDMFDAARIDGAAEWMVFVRIVIPMAKSPLAALAVLTFLGSWDGFMWPLIVINDAKKYTLPLLLNSLRSLYWSRYELWAAGAMLTIAPVMLLYIFSSRFFIRGLAVTGK
jgi:ABC-type glycerol-3-phosphate transport system permease component